jgi:predicted transcriptional regulator
MGGKTVKKPVEEVATRVIAYTIIRGYLIIVAILGLAIVIASYPAGSNSEPLVVTKSMEMLKFLTAVFGAWIGAIIAFYFSKEGTDKITDQLAAHMKELTSLASQAYGITQETLKKLEKHKVEEIMSKPTAANLAQKDTGRNELETKFKDVDVVLVNEKEQLIGIITREDMAKKEKVDTAGDIMTTIESTEKFDDNTVGEAANAYTVYLKMTKTGHEKIPVVNEKKELVGIAQRKMLDKLLRELEGTA